jgi:cysteine-rich repeat protein
MLYRIGPLLIGSACLQVLVACAAPPCGDKKVEGIEECDDGRLNDDTLPDACRTDCRMAWCGDGVVDSGEECDDGNPWGGDGCSTTCTLQQGRSEQEPNQPAFLAEPAGEGALIWGSLPEGDVDCFALDVPEAGSVEARVEGPEGLCSHRAVLSLYDADFDVLTHGVPELESGCATIDPSADTWANYLSAGSYSVCIEGLFGAAVPKYQLHLEAGDSCGRDTLPEPDDDQDLDRDGEADACDDDWDGDGVTNGQDNCPLVPNGPVAPYPWDTADSGFVNWWLVLGPFTDGARPPDCEPSPDMFLGLPDDADAAPVLGDSVGNLAWFTHIAWPHASARLYLDRYFGDDGDQEAYVMTWVRSPAQRDAQLQLGVDDGAFVWLNGQRVGTVTSCQGISTDEFVWDVSLNAGWNRLLFKVFNGAGDWGIHAHFTWPDDTDMRDLEISLAGAQSWLDDQGDMDGDGLGDLCDPDPTRP